MMKKMRRWFYFVCVLFCASILTVTACSKQYTTYEEVSVDTVFQMLDDKESFILFIGSSTCSHCASFEPKLNQVIKKYQVKVYYLDVNQLTETENAKFNARISYGNSTPVTVFIKDGEEEGSYNRIRGDQDIDMIESMFRKNGYIEE